MSVNTKKVRGRRKVSYGTYDDLLADLATLASGPTEVLGNWSFAQICRHLAVALNGSIDGVPFRASLPMRIMATLLMKKRFLTKTLPAGFQIPVTAKAIVEPGDSVELQEQLTALREAIERVKTDKTRARHPFFDELTTEQWDQFNLRHAELHMSFVRPAVGQ